MKWSLAELHRYQDEPLHLQERLALAPALKARFPGQVLAASPVKLDGWLSFDRGDATLTVRVQLTLTVPSTRSLTPVALPLDFSFTETYIADESHRSRYADDDQLVLNVGEHPIDLDEILMENIIEQVPLRVLSPEEAQAKTLPHGAGWQLTAETDTTEQHHQVDPRLAKLKNLFPDQERHD